MSHAGVMRFLSLLQFSRGHAEVHVIIMRIAIDF